MLQALPLLQSRFPIERARMRLKLVVPLAARDELMELLRQHAAAIEEQELIGGSGCGGGWVGRRKILFIGRICTVNS